MNDRIWPISHFDAVMFTFYAVAVLTTAFRVFVRTRILHAFWWDDTLAILATLLGGATCAFDHQKSFYNKQYLLAIAAGEPVKEGPVTPRLLTESARFGTLNVLTYTIELALIKLAILAFYHRLVVSRKHRYVLYGIGSLILAWTISFVIATCLLRNPKRALWYAYDPEYPSDIRCPCQALALINSSLQATFDVLILACPIPIFRALKVNQRAKMGLIVVYLLGFFSLATTLIRLGEGVRYIRITDFVEKRRNCIIFSIWAVIETNTALICANLPALSALLNWAYHTRKTQTKSTSHFGGDVFSGQKHDYGRSAVVSNTVEKQRASGDSYGGIMRTTEISADYELGHQLPPLVRLSAL